MVYLDVYSDRVLNTCHNVSEHWGQFVDIELRYTSNTLFGPTISSYNNKHRTPTNSARIMRSESSSKELNVICETDEMDETDETWYIETYGTKQVSHTPLIICPFNMGTGFMNLMVSTVLGLFGNKSTHIG